jgi:hypothetical protein
VKRLPVHPPGRARKIQAGAGLDCCGLLVDSFVYLNLDVPANAAWFSFLLGPRGNAKS